MSCYQPKELEKIVCWKFDFFIYFNLSLYLLCKERLNSSKVGERESFYGFSLSWSLLLDATKSWFMFIQENFALEIVDNSTRGSVAESVKNFLHTSLLPLHFYGARGSLHGILFYSALTSSPPTNWAHLIARDFSSVMRADSLGDSSVILCTSNSLPLTSNPL